MFVKNRHFVNFCLIPLMFCFDIAKSTQHHLDTKSYKRELTTSVTSIARSKSVSTIHCSTSCSKLRQCVGFYFTKRSNSCTHYRKSVHQQPVSTVFIGTAVEGRRENSVKQSPTALDKEADSCGQPRIQNGFVKEKHWGSGESVVYSCNENYTHCGAHTPHTITCQPDGHWSSPLEPCLRNIWDHFMNGKANSINLPCPIANEARVVIFGKFDSYMMYIDTARLEITLSGQHAALKFQFFLKKKNENVLSCLLKKDAAGFTVIKNSNFAFTITENSIREFVIRVNRNSFSIHLGRRTITRFTLDSYITFNKITINDALLLKKIKVIYNDRAHQVFGFLH